MDHTLDRLELRKREEKLVEDLLEHLKVRFLCPQSELDTIVTMIVKLGVVNSGIEKLQSVKEAHIAKMPEETIEKYTEIAVALKIPVVVAMNKCSYLLKKYLTVIKSLSPLSEKSQSKVISAVKWLREIHAHRVQNSTYKPQVPVCPLWVMRVLEEGNSKCLVEILGVSRITAAQLRLYCCRTVRLLCGMWSADGDLAGTLTPAHWTLLDRCIANGEIALLTPKSLVDQYRQLWSLFHLVQLNNAHHYHLPRSELPKALAKFIHIHDIYNTQGRVLSLICVQRRWYELVRLSRGALVRRYRLLIHGANSDCFAQLHPLYWAVVNSFPSIVLTPLPKWEWLVKNQYVIESKEQYKMLYGDIPPPTIWQINNMDDDDDIALTLPPKDDDDVEIMDDSSTAAVIDDSDDDHDVDDTLEAETPVDEAKSNPTTPRKSTSEMNRSRDSKTDSKLLISPVVKLERIDLPPEVVTVDLSSNDREPDISIVDDANSNIEEEVPDDLTMTEFQLEFVKENYRPKIESGKCCRIRRSRALEALYRRIAASRGLPIPPYTYKHKHRSDEQCQCCCLHLLTRDQTTQREIRRARLKIVSLLKDVPEDVVRVASQDPFYVGDELTDFLMQLKDKPRSYVLPSKSKRDKKKLKRERSQSPKENISNLSDFDLWQREKHKTKQLVAWKKTEFSQKTKLKNKPKKRPRKDKSSSASTSTSLVNKQTVKRTNKSNDNTNSREVNLNKKRKVSDYKETPIKHKPINETKEKVTNEATIIAKDIEIAEIDLREIMKGREKIGLESLKEFRKSNEIPKISRSIPNPSSSRSINNESIYNENIKKDVKQWNDYIGHKLIIDENNTESIDEEINNVADTIKEKIGGENEGKIRVKAEFRLKSPNRLDLKSQDKNTNENKSDSIKKSKKECVSKTSNRSQDKIKDVNKNKNKDTQSNKKPDKSPKDPMMELYLKERMKGRAEFGLKSPKQLDLTNVPIKKPVPTDEFSNRSTEIVSEPKPPEFYLRVFTENEVSEIIKDSQRRHEASKAQPLLQSLLAAPPRGFFRNTVIDLCDDNDEVGTDVNIEPSTEGYTNHSVNENAAQSSKDNEEKVANKDSGIKENDGSLKHGESVIKNAAHSSQHELECHIESVITATVEKTLKKTTEKVLLTDSKEISQKKGGNESVQSNVNQSPQKHAKIGPKCFLDKLKSPKSSECDSNKKIHDIVESKKNQSPRILPKIGPKSFMDKLKSPTNTKLQDTVETNEYQSPRKHDNIGSKSIMDKLKSPTNDNMECSSNTKLQDTVEISVNQSPRKLEKIGPKSFMDKLKSPSYNNTECGSNKKLQDTVEISVNQSPRKDDKIGPKSFMDKLKSPSYNNTECGSNKKLQDTVEISVNQSPRKDDKIDSKSFMDKLKSPSYDNTECGSSKKINEYQSPRRRDKIGPKSFMDKLKSPTNDNVVRNLKKELQDTFEICENSAQTTNQSSEDDKIRSKSIMDKLKNATNDKECDSSKKLHQTVEFNENQSPRMHPKIGPKSFMNKLKSDTNETKIAQNVNANVTIKTEPQNALLDSNSTSSTELDNASNKENDIELNLNVLKERTRKNKEKSMDEILKQDIEESKLSKFAQRITFESDEEFDSNDNIPVLNNDFEDNNDENCDDDDFNSDEINNENIIDSKSVNLSIHGNENDEAISAPISPSDFKAEIKTEVININDSDEETPKSTIDYNALLQKNSTARSMANFTKELNDNPSLGGPFRKLVPNDEKKQILNFNFKDPSNYVDNPNIDNIEKYRFYVTEPGTEVNLEHKNNKGTNHGNTDKSNVTNPKQNADVTNRNIVKNIDIGIANTRNSQNEQVSMIHLSETSDLPICQLKGEPLIVINPRLLKEMYEKSIISDYQNRFRSKKHTNQSTSACNQNVNQSTSGNNRNPNQSIGANLNQPISSTIPPWQSPNASNMQPMRVTKSMPPPLTIRPTPASNNFMTVVIDNNINMYQQNDVNINQSSLNQSTSAINQPTNNAGSNMYPVRVFGSNPTVIEQPSTVPNINTVMPDSNMNSFQHNFVNKSPLNQSTSAINQPTNNAGSNMYPVRVFGGNPTGIEQSSQSNSTNTVAPESNMNMFQQTNVIRNQSSLNQSSLNQSASAINQPVNNVYPVLRQPVFRRNSPVIEIPLTGNSSTITPENNMNMHQNNVNINQSSLNQSIGAINQPVNNAVSIMYPVRVFGGNSTVIEQTPPRNSTNNVTPDSNVNTFQQNNLNSNQCILNQSRSVINQPVNNAASNMYPVRVFGSNPTVLEQPSPTISGNNTNIVTPESNINMFHNNVNINQSSLNQSPLNQSPLNQSTSAINQPTNVAGSNMYPVRVFGSNPTVIGQHSPGNSFINIMPQNNLNMLQQNVVNINMSQQNTCDFNILKDADGNLILYKISPDDK